MLKLLKALDRILRGEVTRPEALADGRIQVSLRSIPVIIVLLAMTYGLCMGSYSLFKEPSPNVVGADRVLQVLASTVKVPLLFVLTLAVTFPSLYVFNALVGSRLSFTSLLRLLVASLAVNLAVLASLGPITAFFSVSTTSYRFMQFFNVIVFGIAGLLGLMFLVQTLNRLSRATEPIRDEPPQPREPLASAELPLAEQVSSDEAESIAPADEVSNADPGDSNDQLLPVVDQPTSDVRTKNNKDVGALERLDGHFLSAHVKTVFRIWIVAFGLVGAQMGWVLRPFIGNPDQPFTWFRSRNSNFFEALLDIVQRLFF